MSVDTEARLEAIQTLNEIRGRGGFVLILYKDNLTDRYLKVFNGYDLPQWLREKFRKQSEEIARVLKEEAAE